MNESNTKIESDQLDTSKKSSSNSKISLWMGILAIFPYACIMAWYWLRDISISLAISLNILAIIGLFLGFVFGIPFGLAAIITGATTLTRKPKMQKNPLYIYIGIIFGIGGIIGHIWYFVTCQFCQ